MLDRNLFDGARHDHGGDRQKTVGDFDDTVGSGVTQRLGDPPNGRTRCLGIELELTAEEALGIEPAEREIGVGHGRLAAAAPVAGGTGRGACALRPDMQSLLRIEPGDRTAAGADLDDIDD